MNKLLTSLMLLLTVLFVGCASAPEATPPALMKGGMLVNAKGLTLYVFDKDMSGSGKSACNGDCAVKWPPHLATGADKASGDFSIVDRVDGRKQWAYKGKPLYTWPEDAEPGDAYGDNYNKVWHIVK